MTRTVLLLSTLLFAGALPAAARVTDRCNSNWGVGEVILQAPAPVRARVLEVVADPTRDPALFDRLWRPGSARILDFAASEDQVILEYERVQDTEQIAAEIRADSVVAGAGISHAYANTTQVCFAAMPPPPAVRLTEYFNVHLNHYFLSSSDVENGVIDSGGAGPGWSRTGQAFRTIPADYCWGTSPVFRFYAPGANSHFFTVHNEECGFLRKSDPGWIFEAEAFGALRPEDGQCPANTVALYRLYNNRWMHNDSNHRFVSRPELRDQMVAQGWTSEGVTMCLPNWGYL